MKKAIIFEVPRTLYKKKKKKNENLKEHEKITV